MPPLFWPVVCLTLGIVASPFVDVRYVPAALALALPIGLARPKLILIAVFLGGILLGNPSVGPSLVPDAAPPANRVSMELTTRPQIEGDAVYLLGDVLEVDGEPVTRGRARLAWFPDDYGSAAIYSSLNLGRGDRIDVLVDLRSPVSSRTPGVFDYARYLERAGVYWVGTIRSPRLIAVGERGWHGADQVRAWVERRITRFFPDPTSRSLVLGMVLGQQSRLEPATQEKFEEAGLIHILVVSGFNLAVVAGAALWLGRRLPLGSNRRLGSRLFALTVILGYAGLVDGGAPVLRATVMAAVLIVGTALDRGYAIGNALLLTAGMMLVLDPASLEDRGFQLSFAAVVSILAVGEPFSAWFLGRVRLALRNLANVRLDLQLADEVTDLRVRMRLEAECRGWPLGWIAMPARGLSLVAEIVLITTSIQICLLPFAVESFHRLSPVSIPLNVIAGMVASVVTPLGLTLIALPQSAGAAVGEVLHVTVACLVWSVDLGLALPAATMRVPSPPPGMWLAVAAGLVLLALSGRRRAPATASVGLLLTLGSATAMAVVDFSPGPPPYPVLTFLDVGQGDSALVELPDGGRIVIDGGGTVGGGPSAGTRFRVGEDIVSRYLFYRRIRHIDTLILTHAHHDHMDGLFDLIANFDIGEAWLGPNPMLPGFRDLLEALYDHGIPIRHVRSGARRGAFEVLNPPSDRRVRNTVSNDDSVVLLMRWGQQSALLTGDVESALPNEPEIVDVLKVPHHGSANTHLRTRGRIPIISVGAHNPFGHPSEKRLPALRTDLLGTIQVSLTPQGPRVRLPGLR